MVLLFGRDVSETVCDALFSEHFFFRHADTEQKHNNISFTLDCIKANEEEEERLKTTQTHPMRWNTSHVQIAFSIARHNGTVLDSNTRTSNSFVCSFEHKLLWFITWISADRKFIDELTERTVVFMRIWCDIQTPPQPCRIAAIWHSFVVEPANRAKVEPQFVSELIEQRNHFQQIHSILPKQIEFSFNYFVLIKKTIFKNILNTVKKQNKKECALWLFGVSATLARVKRQPCSRPWKRW